MTLDQYTMNSNLLARLAKNNRHFCYKCGRELKVGDRIQPRMRTGRATKAGKRTVHYHAECWERLWL